MSCGSDDSSAHTHTWVPDGESWRETTHQPSCNLPDNNLKGLDKAKAAIECECETYRVRRYTCHCGKMKEVKYEE